MQESRTQWQQGGSRTNEDNAKDDDDTLLLLGPVLTLGQLARQKVAGDEGVDGSHCVKERSGDD